VGVSDHSVSDSPAKQLMDFAECSEPVRSRNRFEDRLDLDEASLVMH
jgi:hypothetical protein